MSNKLEYEMTNKHRDSKLLSPNEAERKIIPKEVRNLNFVLKNYPNVSKYSWEVDGERVI
jgi:hypothetical protein